MKKLYYKLKIKHLKDSRDWYRAECITLQREKMEQDIKHWEQNYKNEYRVYIDRMIGYELDSAKREIEELKIKLKEYENKK